MLDWAQREFVMTASNHIYHEINRKKGKSYADSNLYDLKEYTKTKYNENIIYQCYKRWFKITSIQRNIANQST